MLYLLDIADETYSSVMAVVNYVCFAALCGCCVVVYFAGVIGQLQNYYKGIAVGAIIGVIVLLVINYFFIQYLGISLLVPPIGTPYFTDFMHVIQYLASIAVVLLAIVIFATALLSKLDRYYSHTLMSALLFLFVIVGLHFYIYNIFGILLIFPPNLW